MQVMYSVVATVDGDAIDAFDDVVATTAAWAFGETPVPDSGQDESGELALTSGYVKWEVQAVDGLPHRVWRLERCSPLGEDGGAEFVCATTVARTATQAAVHVEMGRRSTSSRLAPAPIDFFDRPRHVPAIVAGRRYMHGTDVLRASPISAMAADAGSIADLIEAQDRQLPVIVVSSTADGSPESRFASVLADRLAGLAHVALMRTWLALDSLNARLTARPVPVRGARLYWPIAAGAPRHPWWTPQQLRDPRAVGDRLFAMLARLSVVANPRNPLLDEVRDAERRANREAAERRVAEALASGDAAKLSEELSAQLDAERKQVLELLELNEVLEAGVRDLRPYKVNFESLTAWQGQEQHEVEEEPQSFELAVSPDFRELWPALEAETDEALTFTEAAKSSWVDSPYPFPDRMRETLQTLARAAVAWRQVEGRLGRSLTSWLSEEHGLTYAGDDETMRRMKIDSFIHDDVSYSRLPHIKIDDHVSPDRVGRVYFAIDQDRLRWVVDHVGVKLY